MVMSGKKKKEKPKQNLFVLSLSLLSLVKISVSLLLKISKLWTKCTANIHFNEDFGLCFPLNADSDFFLFLEYVWSDNMVCQSVPPAKQGTQRDSPSFFKTQPVQSPGTAGKATTFPNILHLWSGHIFCSMYFSWNVISKQDCWIPWFPDCIFEQFAPSFWSTKQDKLYWLPLT